MSAEEILKTEGIFLKNETIGGINCSIGYIKKFRWSWFATQLNTFVFIGETSSTVDRALIEKFSDDCYKYAIGNNRGWPRGLQSGVGSIAILKGNTIDPSAVEYCRKLIKKHWSAFEIPVVHDKQTKQTTRYTSNPIWGRIYFPYFSKLIDNLSSKL